MVVNSTHEQVTAASVTSDEYSTSFNASRRPRPSARGTNKPWGPISEASNPNRIASESQGLEARLSELLQSEEWDQNIQSDPARSHLLSQMKSQLQSSLAALSYIQNLEHNFTPSPVSTRELPPRQQNHEHGSISSTRIGDYVRSYPAEPSVDWKLEVKRWKRVDGRTGSMDIYDENEKIEDIRKRENEIRGGGYVLNVYDVYDSEGSGCQSVMEISSTPLLDLLREVITFYPGDEFNILRGKDSMDFSVVFPDPYVMFFSCRKQLEQCLKREGPKEAKEAKDHLKVLLDFLQKEHPVWSKKLAEIEEGRCKSISFHSLWLLYPPSTPVYACEGVDDRQMVVYFRDGSFGKSSAGAVKSSVGPLTVRCWDVKYEQGAFRRTFSDIVIEPFSGVRNISQLPLVPERYMPREMELRNRLITRGRTYFQLKQAAQLQDYYGDRFPRVFNDEPVRVVVDEETYYRKNPRKSSLAEKPSEDYGLPDEEETLVDENHQPLDTTLLRCFPELGVFSLRDRQWALVKVDDLKPVKFRDKAFGKLVIKKEYKSLLKALVRAYMQESAFFRDIVPGKGRGIAILLHGPPGTGKTLTAECVAEREQRPLYTISCGDLGTEPEQLELRLKEVFEYAVSWKAILLLDEADIFLQERNMNDLKRNALVTIFLRELEYFDGILFLTTNRPGDIDEAFVSRMHVTLGLSQPHRDERFKIWKIFIKDLDMPEDEQRTLLTYATEKFEKDDLNGRQIRNTVRVALALAKLEDSNIRPKHLEEVIKIGREYARYIENLNKMSPEDTAIQLGRRAPME
ncbi:MAG: hypothetical protein LQ342_002128 [Letrouitia transgressa]|nr:MAG: hypothetical protein LQ342_002128 [Letrouitia transgressa]